MPENVVKAEVRHAEFIQSTFTAVVFGGLI